MLDKNKKKFKSNILMIIGGIFLLCPILVTNDPFKDNSMCQMIWCNKQATPQIAGVKKSYNVYYCENHQELADLLRYPFAGMAIVGFLLIVGGVCEAWSLVKKSF